jgi:hypothetical protein
MAGPRSRCQHSEGLRSRVSRIVLAAVPPPEKATLPPQRLVLAFPESPALRPVKMRLMTGGLVTATIASGVAIWVLINV